MPTFDPAEPLEVAAYRANLDAARTNALAELRDLRAALASIERDLVIGDRPSASDTRRLNADTFELTRYATEVSTLIDNRPLALRTKES